MWKITHNNWKNESSNNFCFSLQIFRFGLFFSLFFFDRRSIAFSHPNSTIFVLVIIEEKKSNPPSATAVWRRMIYEPLVRLPRRSLPSDQPFQARGMRNNCQRVSKIFSHFLFSFYFPPQVETDRKIKYEEEIKISQTTSKLFFLVFETHQFLLFFDSLKSVKFNRRAHGVLEE